MVQGIARRNNTKVLEGKKLKSLSNSKNQKAITNLFAEIQTGLEKRTKKITESAILTEEGFLAGMGPLFKKIQLNLGATGSLLNQISTVIKNIEISHKKIAENLGQDSDELTEEVENVTNNLNSIKDTINNKTLYEEVTEFVDQIREAAIEFKAQKQIQDLSLRVELVQYLKEEEIIGGGWTLISVKNQNSFMTATKGKGLKIFEHGIEVYSQRLAFQQEPLLDMIYVESLNSYFMDHNDQIYRKDIDDQPPYPSFEVKCGVRYGGSLRYSKLQKSLIVNQNATDISVIELENNVLEFEVKKSLGANITDFRIFGKKEDRVIAVTTDGYVLLYNLDYKKKTGSVISHIKLDLIEDRKEEPQTISVCGNGQYALLEIGNSEISSISSRMMVFRLIADKLRKTAAMDQHNQEIGEKAALECLGEFGRHILWISASRNENGILQVFDYDTKTKVIQELDEKRLRHKELDPARFNILGDKFCFIGDYGKLMCLSIGI